MFPRAVISSFEKLDDIEIDDQTFNTFALLPAPSPGSAPWKVGPKGQIMHPKVHHAIRLLSASVAVLRSAKPPEKVAWSWAHVTQEGDNEPVTIDKYVYPSMEDAVFQTNAYLLGWLDDINHVIEFSDINPATIILTDDWKPDDLEVKHAVSAFEGYIKTGLFVKECALSAQLDLKKNIYRNRFEDDFRRLAKIRLEPSL